MRGLGSFHVALARRFVIRYFWGWILRVDGMKFSRCMVFVPFLGFRRRFLMSSHSRCFLLLRHFALMLLPQI